MSFIDLFSSGHKIGYPNIFRIFVLFLPESISIDNLQFQNIILNVVGL